METRTLESRDGTRPAGPQDWPAGAPGVSVASGRTVSANDHHLPPVLVVDDEEGIRTALATYLERQQYPVHTAANGEEALDLLRQHTDVAVVLCDIRMPDLNGVEVVPRALELNPDLAILMLTAVHDPKTAVECMKLGAFDYLMKPVVLDDVKGHIVQALRRRQLRLERRDLEAWLSREVAERTKEVEESAAKLHKVAEALKTLTDRTGHPTTLREAVDDAEARAIKRALDYTDGNRQEAAKLLGISPRTLFYKIKQLGI